jgi:hypothetical protein
LGSLRSGKDEEKMKILIKKATVAFTIAFAIFGVFACFTAIEGFALSRSGSPGTTGIIGTEHLYAKNAINAQAATEESIAFGFTQKTIYVKRGKTVKLPFVVYTAEDGTRDVSWSTSDKKISTVKKGKGSGKITVTGNRTEKLTVIAGKKLGKSKITLSSGEKKTVLTVNVVSKAKAVRAIKIKGLPGLPKARYIYAGKSLKLKPSFTKGATVIATWKSSKPEVAEVDAAGKLTTHSRGWVAITLKAGNKDKKVKIKVFGEGEDFDICPAGAEPVSLGS